MLPSVTAAAPESNVPGVHLIRACSKVRTAISSMVAMSVNAGEHRSR